MWHCCLLYVLVLVEYWPVLLSSWDGPTMSLQTVIRHNQVYLETHCIHLPCVHLNETRLLGAWACVCGLNAVVTDTQQRRRKQHAVIADSRHKHRSAAKHLHQAAAQHLDQAAAKHLDQEAAKHLHQAVSPTCSSTSEALSQVFPVCAVRNCNWKGVRGAWEKPVHIQICI